MRLCRAALPKFGWTNESAICIFHPSQPRQCRIRGKPWARRLEWPGRCFLEVHGSWVRWSLPRPRSVIPSHFCRVVLPLDSFQSHIVAIWGHSLWNLILTPQSTASLRMLRCFPWRSCKFIQPCPSLKHHESESRSVVSDSLWPHGLYSLWNSPGQNTGVEQPFPSPGDLPNPGLPHCRWILYLLSHKGSPWSTILC